MSKEEIRQRAAIAVLPECVRTCNEVLLRGGKLTEETQAKQAAMMAVAYADELAEKLSSVEQNGKECKPANFAKSSKDLQEAPHGDDCKGCKGFEETGKCYCEGCEGMPQELTEFEENFLAILYSWCKGDDRVYNECKDGALKDAKKLLEIAYYEFEKVLLNSKLEYFENLFVRFNDAVDEEIKRRCEGIDVDEMFDKVPPRIFKTDFDFYKKGVVDTINKLKGE